MSSDPLVAIVDRLCEVSDSDTVSADSPLTDDHGFNLVGDPDPSCPSEERWLRFLAERAGSKIARRASQIARRELKAIQARDIVTGVNAELDSGEPISEERLGAIQRLRDHADSRVAIVLSARHAAIRHTQASGYHLFRADWPSSVFDPPTVAGAEASHSAGSEPGGGRSEPIAAASSGGAHSRVDPRGRADAAGAVALAPTSKAGAIQAARAEIGRVDLGLPKPPAPPRYIRDARGGNLTSASEVATSAGSTSKRASSAKAAEPSEYVAGGHPVLVAAKLGAKARPEVATRTRRLYAVHGVRDTAHGLTPLRLGVWECSWPEFLALLPGRRLSPALINFHRVYSRQTGVADVTRLQAFGDGESYDFRLAEWEVPCFNYVEVAAIRAAWEAAQP